MNFRRYLQDDGDNLIDLAPLIDVVFILLIFFMVSTTFNRESKLEINLPEASVAAQDNVEKELVVLSIDAKGRYSVDGKVLINGQLATIKAALERVSKSYQTPSLLINADGDAPHSAVIKAMDAAQQIGLTKMGLATNAQAADADK